MTDDGFHIHDGGVDREFADMMMKLAAAWGTTLTEARIRIYAKALGDVPFKLVASAAGRAVRERDFFPSISVLRGYVGPSADDLALISWSAFETAASMVGAYASLDVEDGAAAVALTEVFGGWPQFCRMDDGPALALKRQEYLAAYRQARRRMVPPRRLIGLCEASGQYPTGPEATTVWCARLTAGGVERTREQARLGAGHGPHDRLALREGTNAQAAQGSEAAGGDDADSSGPPTGRDA